MIRGLTLSLAATGDEAFIVEMARHASVIEDWPLPDPDSDDTRSLLAISGGLTIVAKDQAGIPIGAAWTVHHDPPLLVDSNGVAPPEVVLAVAPGMRGRGVGGALLDELIDRCIGMHQALTLNVHQRNTASRLYERKGFRVHGQGRGALGIAMLRELR